MSTNCERDFDKTKEQKETFQSTQFICIECGRTFSWSQATNVVYRDIKATEKCLKIVKLRVLLSLFVTKPKYFCTTKCSAKPFNVIGSYGYQF